jgi:hypothetical protein
MYDPLVAEVSQRLLSLSCHREWHRRELQPSPSKSHRLLASPVKGLNDVNQHCRNGGVR